VQVHVTFRPRRQPDRTLDVPAGATVAEVLAAAGQSADSTLVVRGETPITERDEVRDGETLLLLSAFSGG
jgi:sulfur carrier protein ThiS